MSFGEALVYFCVLGPAKEMIRLKPKPELYQSIKGLGDRIKSRSSKQSQKLRSRTLRS